MMKRRKTKNRRQYRCSQCSCTVLYNGVLLKIPCSRCGGEMKFFSNVKEVIEVDRYVEQQF
jgi:transcription initiation factor IIE alpha subunit